MPGNRLPAATLLATVTLLQVSTARADCSSSASEHPSGAALRRGSEFMGIRLLADLRLRGMDCGGLPLMGLSALAWVPDTDVLYALAIRRFERGRSCASCARDISQKFPRSKRKKH